ncbi:ABC transporter permease [Planctobacterium marinum]|uniref:ABC transporter permease n=1 Tax=Planctobacterium marinum TaxID=1631968 RepID=A0AA48HLI0_9ALTE|nr:ABC transporter permease [Planctobacterium marinum]
MIIALVTGITGLSSVLVINATAKQSYANATPPLFAQLQFRISAKQGQKLVKSDYVEGRRDGLGWVPVMEYSGRLTSHQQVTILGIDPLALSLAQQGLEDTSMQNPGNVLMSRGFARTLGVSSGDTLRLSDGRILGSAFVVSQGLQDEVLLMDIAEFMRVLQHPEIDEFWLFDIPEESQLNRLHQRFEVDKVYYEDPATLTDSFHLNLLAMGLLMFIVCLFIVMNAFHLLYTERQPMFVMLRQMGVSRQTLFKAIFLELLLLCLFTSVLGLWLGVQLAYWLSPAVELTLTSLYELDVSFNQTNLLSLFLLSFSACLAGAIIAVLNPLLSLNRRLANIKAQQNTGDKRFWWAVVLAFAIGFMLSSLLATSLLMHFVSVACLILLGCALMIVLIPILLKHIACRIPAKYALLHWSAADSLRIARRSNIAMCAFFIAVTANVGMNLMVDSFRQATTSWLQQRLVADFYVSSDHAQRVKDYFSETHPGVWLWERKRLAGTLNADVVDVIAYPEHPDYQRAVGLKKAMNNAWQRFLEDGVFINEQLAYKQQLQIGQTIDFYADKKRFTRTIVGIHYDYGNMDNQILLPDTQVSSNAAERFLFAVHLPEGYSLDFATITEQLNQRDSTASVSDLQQIMRFSMQTFDRAFIVTGALNVITLLVAGLSLATSISLIEVQNTGPSGVLRALGVSRMRLTACSLAQYGLLAMLTALVAIPFGALLSYLLINKINVASFAWSYPMLFNGTLVFQLMMLSVTIVLMAVIFPLWHSHRKPIAKRLAEL